MAANRHPRETLHWSFRPAADPLVSTTLPATASAWHQRIWQLTWPVILANITIPLVGVADAAVMGRFPDPALIASVTMGAAMFSAVYWLFGFLRMATTGLSAQAYGAGNLQEVLRVGMRSGTAALIIGAVIVALQVPLAALLFRLFDASARVAELAQIYYDIRIFGAPALLMYLVVLGMLFGLQRMRETLWLSVGLNLTNLVLDVVLVLVFDLGVAGVAIGTVVSEWGAAVGGFFLLRRALRQTGWAGQTPRGIWRDGALASMFHVSGNLVLRTFFVQLPFLAGTILATRLGDVTLAAHGVLMQLFFVMTYSLDGFAHTAETLAGFSYGARAKESLRRATVYCGWWALGLALVTGLTYLAAGDLFVALITTSPEVREMAAAYLPWLALAPLLCVWAFLFDGVFIGTTHIVEMRNAMLASTTLWAILLWLSFDLFGYHAVWLAMSVFMLARSGLLFLYYPRIERHAVR